VFIVWLHFQDRLIKSHCENLQGKNSFVTATKLGTTNQFFVAASKNFAAATKRFY